MVDLAKLIPKLKEIPKEYHGTIVELLQEYYKAGKNRGFFDGVSEGYDIGFMDGTEQGHLDRERLD